MRKREESHIPSISTFYEITATGEILDGSLPNNALKLVREWLGLHRSELQHMWESQEFKKITPLDEEER